MTPSFVELLSVREVESMTAAPPGDRRDWPLDAQPAELRTLPYPFTTYVGFSNDCDTAKFTFEEVRDFFGFVREKLNLPFGDSFFPDLLVTGIIPYQPATKVESISGVLRDPSGPAFRNRIGNYLKHFHLGWFDTVHGFVAQIAIRLPYTAEDEEIAQATAPGQRDPNSPYLPRRRVLALNSERYKSRERFKFYAPPGRERQITPRYVVLNCWAPRNSTTLRVRLFEGEEVIATGALNSDLPPTPLSAPRDYVIDLWRHVGLARPRLDAIEVEIEIAGREGAFAEINDIFLINHLRSDLKRYQRGIESYNMTTPVFTSHGTGLVVSPAFGGAEAAETDLRRLSDVPNNPHYGVDVLRDYGVKFVNTFSNTSRFRVVYIDELTFPNCLSDGRVIYDFYRYSYAPRTPQGIPDMTFWHRGGKLINLSLVDAIGDGLFGLLSEVATEPGIGGLFYTHVYAANVADPSQDPELYTRPMNRKTRQVLETLAERYYNLSGATPEPQRVFLASQPALLRYSVVRKGLDGRVFYRPSSNTIHIEPWFDPVLDETIPSGPNDRELRGITFYVDDAHTARVFIGEREFADLIRNSKDASGRESITVADVSAPLILAGRVPLPATCAMVDVTGARAAFGEISERQPAEQGVQLTLGKTRATLSVQPRDVSAANYHAIRIVITKSDAAVCFGLIIEFESGLRLRILERGVDGDEPVHVLPAYECSGERIIIVPFYLLLAGSRRHQPDEKSPGLNRITRWTLVAQGPVKTCLRLNALQLLRDCEQKPSTDGFVVAGSVKNTVPPVERVRMRYRDWEYETLSTADGVYFFDRKVAADSVIEIYGLDKDKAEIEPANGRFFHIVTNKSDIDFAPAS